MGKIFKPKRRKTQYLQKVKEVYPKPNANVKFLLYLLAWGALAMGIYLVALRFEFEPILYIYYGLAIVCFLIFFFLNGGISPRKIENIERPEEMPYDEFAAYLEKIKLNRTRAKYFLVAFLPPFLCLVGDYLITFWSAKFK